MQTQLYRVLGNMKINKSMNGQLNYGLSELIRISPEQTENMYGSKPEVLEGLLCFFRSCFCEDVKVNT